jgi:hypothetical protein
MHHDDVKPAVLDEGQVARLQKFEHELGEEAVVIAYSKTLEPVELTPEQVKRLREVEEELGVYLVAWRKAGGPCS